MKKYASANFIILVLILLISFSCLRKKENKASIAVDMEILKADNNNPCRVKFRIKEYVMLEISSNSMITKIDKLKIKDGRIYILDLTGKNYLFVFKLNGKFLHRVGQIGRGPGEYSKLCDFDVDDTGQIFLYNRQLKKMMIYTQEGKFIKEIMTPFRADGFNLLKGNRYLFSVVKDNRTLKSNPKVIVTDSLMSIVNAYFKYSPNYKDNKGNTNIFHESPFGLIYNKPVCNYLHLIGWNGELKRTYQIDFGSESLPENYINDYIEYMMSKERVYDYLYRTPLIVSNLIVGNMYIGTDKALFVFDLNTANNGIQVNKFLPNNFSHKQLTEPLYAINDSVIISYLDYETFSYSTEKEDINSDLLTYLKNGGIAIALYSIKRL